ncbi:hypothetical protein K0M31_001880 [Melipona bicolor]|uniref:TIL domain-containing protein n=1 Tax=Melipona bicolor TaxID=60889 RepID=A0AA40GGD7_9HYME|nr:hypothetical protein K0M31_001880 [Melipona bicolor]
MQRYLVAFLLAVVFINVCSLTPICPINEEWNICGQLCEPSCAILNPIICPRIVCTNETTAGCRCISGFLKNQNNDCVQPKDC